MKTLAGIAAATCALLSTVGASAQDGDAPPAGAAAPAAPAAAMPVTACRAGEHSGVDEPDAATATRLVCAEIARAGAAAGSHYRVVLGRLGTMIILTVTRDGEAPDTIADSREARLHSIEEISIMAPRIADAIVHGTALKDTETVNNLVADETRAPRTKSASFHFALGLIGQFPPFDRTLAPAPGVNLELHAEANPFEIVGNFRVGGGGNTGTGSVMTKFEQFSVGGRFFTSDADFSPYVGVGLSWGSLTVHDGVTDPANAFYGTGDGLGAYGELGVEIMRTHHAHLAFGARLDTPFYAMKMSGDTYTTGDGTPGGTPAQSVYYAPLSFELRLTF